MPPKHKPRNLLKRRWQQTIHLGLSALSLALLTLPLSAQVVINEVFYNAPTTSTTLQWIELYNNAEQPADLSGWTIEVQDSTRSQEP